MAATQRIEVSPSRGNSGFMNDNMDVELAVTEAPIEAEKQLSQSQVNDIVKREKARAADSARREMQQAHSAELEQLRSAPTGNQVDVEAIKNEVLSKFMGDLKKHHEEVEHENQKRELKTIADQYHLKMAKGSELFDDFNEVMAPFKAHSFPNLVMLTADMENTPEIMYELANNPEKLQQIDALAEKSPEMALRMLEKLSGSINRNLEAKQSAVSAPSPLSRLKSSTVGADSGKMTLQDLKAQPYLRG